MANIVEDLKDSFGTNNYVEYIKGNIALVISVPHGGRLKPESIPKRSGPNVCNDADLFTAELARKIVAVMEEKFPGRRPHVIINHLHRSRLDANRDMADAALGQPEAEVAWKEFHAYIDAAKQYVAQHHTRGLLIDLHGQAHDPRLQLGYLVRGVVLKESDEQLDQHHNRCSVVTLLSDTGNTLSNLLRGQHSLGSILDKYGYECVPSSRHPDAGEVPYFNGGYNTRRHGSLQGGPFDAIQIETNYEGSRDSPEARARLARAFVSAVAEFLSLHFPESCHIASQL
eukprot:TRINITY_DN387_c0_g3_i1.p1 TRINITY_DN387_c0_g3~~TRINITY_DN387_c0_g3_i1.p1  ORF type:complete len:285 (-),score=66.62 TRINITY_DN387_c0_g3_i1:52-906(-)